MVFAYDVYPLFSPAKRPIFSTYISCFHRIYVLSPAHIYPMSSIYISCTQHLYVL